MAIHAQKISSGNYRARVTYFDNEGKQHSKSFTKRTKKEAETAAYAYKVNRTKKQEPENITIGEAIDTYLDSNKNNYSPSTIALYSVLRNSAYAYIINKRLGSLTPLMIQKTIGEYRVGRKAKTVRNAYSFLRQVLKQFKLDYLCDDVLMPQKDAKEIQIPSENEVDKFLEAIKDNRLYLYVLFACFGGLRRGEIIALTWGDIDFKKRLINIDKGKIRNEFGQFVHKGTPKTDKSIREVGLVDELFEALKEVKENREAKASELVIVDKPAAMIAAYERARTKFGFNYNFHALRHYYTSVLLVMGAPIKDVSEILGHSTIQTTQRVYAHTFPETKQDIYKQFNERINKRRQNEEEKGEEE